jgi:perosamine synthetase
MIVSHSRPTIDQDDINAVACILASGKIAQGLEVKKFEKEIAGYVGTRYAAACSSGTAAIHLALIGLGLKPQEKVAMPSYVCTSPYFAALHADAKPEIIDIDPLDLNISSSAVRKQVTHKTRAIIVPHMFGNPAELEELLEAKIPIIEDCAQSLGAEYKNKRVGSFGALAVFSFYATKIITTGEGGMVLTNDSEYYSRIIEARDYDKKPLFPTKYNYKMTDLGAALGRSQFKKLQYFIECRRKVAAIYKNTFSEHKIVTPTEYPHKKHVFFRYVIMINNAYQLERDAKKNGVMCEKPVWKPIHQNLKSIKCPNTDYVYRHALSVPIYPSLSEKEIEYVTETLETILRKYERQKSARYR